MIIYATKQTRERYNLPKIENMPNDLKIFNQTIIEKESGNELLEWGAKLFYFDSKKCLQLVNFASKFTLCKRILKKSIFVLVYEHKRRRLL